MIHQITFSPTGGTKRVGQLLAQNLGTDVQAIELCVPESKLTIPSIKADDLVVIASICRTHPSTCSRASEEGFGRRSQMCSCGCLW